MELSRLERSLARPAAGHTSAAVAVVLRDDARGPSLLFIRRPVRASDRWSGHVAFPGGLAREGEDAIETARREAREEVAIALGHPMGRLADRVTLDPRRVRAMRVRPIVFAVPRDTSLAPDPREVREAFWVPLARIARLPIVFALRRVGPLALPFPSMDLDGHILWGLTLSMVRELRGLVR